MSDTPETVDSIIAEYPRAPQERALLIRMTDYARLKEAEVAALKADPCVVDEYSSRACERGTHACIKHHAAIDAAKEKP